MLDKNIYHLTMQTNMDIPEIHGDIHRPSDYNLDKIYLLSKTSDVLEDIRNYGVISGFTLLQPTGLVGTGNVETNTLEYSLSPTHSIIQFDDGYIMVSYRFLIEIQTHNAGGNTLPNPVPIEPYFGILYCPKEKNIIENVDLIPSTRYIYIKYKYDVSSSNLLLKPVSRQRQKVSLPINYVFIGADFYEIVLSPTLISPVSDDYLNYVLLGVLEISGSSRVLKIQGYTSHRRLNNLVSLYTVNSSGVEVYYKLRNLERKYYVQSYTNIHNHLNSQSDFSSINHYFPELNGEILVNNHFKHSNGTLNPTESLFVNYANKVKYIIFVFNSNKSLEVEMYNGNAYIKNNTFSSSEISLTESTIGVNITNNLSSPIDYFVYKIDKNRLGSF